VNTVALGQVPLAVLLFSPASVTVPLLTPEGQAGEAKKPFKQRTARSESGGHRRNCSPTQHTASRLSELGNLRYSLQDERLGGERERGNSIAER
jgi:hypothetical protein